MKRSLIAFILILGVLSACLVGCTMPDIEAEKANAAAVFTLDVNPGVRIYVRADNTVIAVEATNGDGEEIVAELDIKGLDYEGVVEDIVDKMEEKGYLNGEESSVLISVEKKIMDISEKVNEKLEKAFEKHGKRASVIEQELDGLGEEASRVIGDIADKYNISEGKARLIEKIREEAPELSEEELAKLKVNELGMMLEDASDDIKEQFKKVGKPTDGEYMSREQALDTALVSLEITVDDVTMQRVRVTHGEGKLLYEVEFVYDGMEYEILIDVKTGEILSTESEEFVEFDAKGVIEDFCDKHNIDPDKIKDKIFDGVFGKGDREEQPEKEQDTEKPTTKPLTKGEILKAVFEEFDISGKEIKKTDVKIYETENGAVYCVTIKNAAGDLYTVAVEAYSGTVIKAELNGTEIEIPVETDE